MGPLLVLAAMAAASNAAAQSDPFPTRQPVRLVSSLGAGSSGDRLARNFADQLSARLNQKVIVENRTGDGGNIAALHVVKANPDGYTLLFSSTASLAIQMVYNADAVTYSFTKDLLPVSTVAMIANGLFMSPTLEPDNLPALVKELKSKPGQYACASSGTGGLLHLTCELFKRVAGVNLLHVAYKGSTAFLTDLVSGRVAIAFDNVPVYVPLVNSGRLKVMAVTSPKRVAVLPYVPTTAEVGMPQLESMGLFGLLAPLRTPDAATTLLAGASMESLRDKAARERAAREGVDLNGSSPDGLRKQIDNEINKWSRLIKEANIKRE